MAPRSVTCKASLFQGQAPLKIVNKIPCHSVGNNVCKGDRLGRAVPCRTRAEERPPLPSAGPPFPAREQWLGQKEARRLRRARSPGADDGQARDLMSTRVLQGSRAWLPVEAANVSRLAVVANVSQLVAANVSQLDAANVSLVR